MPKVFVRSLQIVFWKVWLPMGFFVKNYLLFFHPMIFIVIAKIINFLKIKSGRSIFITKVCEISIRQERWLSLTHFITIACVNVQQTTSLRYKNILEKRMLNTVWNTETVGKRTDALIFDERNRVRKLLKPISAPAGMANFAWESPSPWHLPEESHTVMNNRSDTKLEKIINSPRNSPGYAVW